MKLEGTNMLIQKYQPPKKSMHITERIKNVKMKKDLEATYSGFRFQIYLKGIEQN